MVRASPLMSPSRFGLSLRRWWFFPSPRIASNQMLLNFGRTRSLGGSSHYIRDTWAPLLERLAATRRRTCFGRSSCRPSVLLIPAVVRPNSHYVNQFVRGFGRPGSRRISSARFGPSRLRMRHIIRPQIVAPAIQSAPVAADSVAAIAHRAFSLAGTILIPDCAPSKGLSPALFPQLSTAPIHSSGRSRP